MDVELRRCLRAIAKQCTGILVCVAVTLWSAAASGLTQIDFVSAPGDYIGFGETFSLTPADGSIVATPSDSGVYVSFFGTPSVSPKTFWFLHFVPLKGASLTSGNYPSAQRWPFQSPKRPGLDISGDGRGCNTLTGTFTVYEATFATTGEVVAFAADAEQHCEGASAPALRVRVRINSDVPLLLSAPQSIPGWPQEVSQKELVTLDGTQSYDPDGQIVSWRWSQISGPAVSLSSPKTPVTTFRAPRVPRGGADIELQLEVQDDSGNGATGTVAVHVFNPSDRRTLISFVSPPGDYIGQGVTETLTPAEGDFAFNRNAGLPNAVVNFDGGLDWWEADFAAPDGGPLVPGTYLRAERFPYQSAGRPGLSFDGSGRGCNTLSGQFTITEFDPTTDPPRFGATFVQSCEGFMPALHGTVLFNAVPPSKVKAHVGGPKQMPDKPVSTLRFELEVMDEHGSIDADEITIVGE